jgi:hypothetical protein
VEKEAHRITKSVKRQLKAIREGKQSPKAPPALEAAGVPIGRRYTTVIQAQFLTTCIANRGSKSACECILAKFEESPVEMAQSIAEALYFDEVQKRHEAQPHRFREWIEECKLKA